MKIGDYLQIASYLEAPILWRCVSFHKMIQDNNIIL